MVQLVPNDRVSLVREHGLLGALAFELEAVGAAFMELLRRQRVASH